MLSFHSSEVLNFVIGFIIIIIIMYLYSAQDVCFYSERSGVYILRWDTCMGFGCFSPACYTVTK